MADNIHDKGYKRILSQKKQFAILLKRYLNATWAQSLCEDDMELVDKEFILKDFKDKEADIIYRLHIDGKEVLVYCLLELQSSVDFTMPFRLLVYMVELLKRVFLDTPEEERTRKEYRLPAVIPMVLYNGSNTWTANKRFKDYQNGADMFCGFAIDFEYHLVDVSRQDVEQLQGIGGILAAVFLLDGIKKGKEMSSILEKVSFMVSKLNEDEKIAFMDWIRDVFLKKAQPNDRKRIEKVLADMKGDVSNMTYAIERICDEMRAEGIAEGEARGEARGIAKGEARGEARGKIESAVNIIKKLNIPVTEAMQVVGLPESEQERVITELNEQNVIYSL